jgi:type IV pilus assembly protein PilM
VNVGNEIATIIVHQDGVPAVTRDILFGSKQMRDDQRRLHGLSIEEAETVLQGKSRDRQYDQVLHERGSELAVAIERATAFMGTDVGTGSNLGAVYMTGGAARVPRLQDAISERIRARIEVVNPLQRLDVAPEAMADLPGDELAPMWMLPVGLALRVPA